MIIFVYNADSGKLNALWDSAHKLLSPETYQCRLCELTYGLVSEKQLWKDFRQQFEQELVFLHRDEFEKRYEQKTAYPVIFREEQGELETLVSADEFSTIRTTQDLIQHLKTVLAD